jgi:ATP-binding cassette subfamily B protein
MAIFISHRFSTTRRADRILVLENAQLIEQGTHAELMLLDGRYAELFNLQAESYLETLPVTEFAPAPGPDWMHASA